MADPDLYVVTEVVAAGKSPVAKELAHRLERSAHVRGDVFRWFIVAARDPIAPPLSAEAECQLALRRSLAADSAFTYWAAGLTTVLQDFYWSAYLVEVTERVVVARPHVVVRPSAKAVAEREAGCEMVGYCAWDVESPQRTFIETAPDSGSGSTPPRSTSPKRPRPSSATPTRRRSARRNSRGSASRPDRRDEPRQGVGESSLKQVRRWVISTDAVGHLRVRRSPETQVCVGPAGWAAAPAPHGVAASTVD